MNTLKTDQSQFPVQEWTAAMNAAVTEICELGGKLVATHRSASEQAEEVCRNWNLEQRQAGERAALESLFEAAREILGKLEKAIKTRQPEAMSEAAYTIEAKLQGVEDAFLQVRHSAQDLLHWSRRYGKPEDDGLTEAYRASHGKLTSFTPVFKPALESFQMELLDLVAAEDAAPGVRKLLSAITRYNAVLESARRFVQAVVEPPLELVFAETEEFLADFGEIPLSERGMIASELNDCCQSLQYDRAGFEEKVAPLPLQQPEGIDSSLVVFDSNGMRILMTVDEDPIFEQITVHLLRAVSVDEYGKACTLVTEALCDEWR